MATCLLTPIKCICLPSPSNLQMTNKNKIFYSKVRGCFVSTLVSGRQYGTVSTLVSGIHMACGDIEIGQDGGA